MIRKKITLSNITDKLSINIYIYNIFTIFNPFCRSIFPFWGIFLCFSCSTDLQGTNSLSLPPSEIVFILPIFMKDIIIGYKILVWQVLFVLFWHFKVALTLWLWLLLLSSQLSLVSFFSLYVLYCFSLSVFQISIFLFSLIFISLAMLYLSGFLLCLSCLRFEIWDSGTQIYVYVWVWIKFGKLFSIISSIIQT